MTKNIQIVCLGSISRDLMFYTPAGKVFIDQNNQVDSQWLAFVLATKVDMPEFYYTWGGGAANTAVGLAKLGLKVGVVGCIGDDHDGRRALVNLKNFKVDTTGVTKTKKAQTGLSIIVSRQSVDKEHVAFVHRGANDYFKFVCPTKYLAAKYFYLNTLNGEAWLKILKQIFATARQQQIKIYWNPGGKQLAAGLKALEPFLAQTEILQLNQEEAKKLLVSALSAADLSQPKRLLIGLSALGPKLVIVTLGEQGAIVYDGHNFYSQPIYPSKNVDTIGVGDSFGAAFLASLIYQPQQITTALAWGLINSGCNVAKIGAQEGIITKAEISKKFKQWFKS
ncbi:MAG: carbohydrate kinase family protein [Candidatus Buchananbacteria bacterium]